jgi:hypothetical protein
LGGMITGTALVILFAPLFYVLIEKTFGKGNQPPATGHNATTSPESH